MPTEQRSGASTFRKDPGPDGVPEWMSPLRLPMLIAAAHAGLRVTPTVRLSADAVVVDATASALVDRFRHRMSDGPDVLAAEPDRIVRRFRGHAGRFRYETIELVTFERAAITFEHLAGPFARCRETFALEATDGGHTRMTHTGTFALRGGLWAWPLARTSVKQAFERHVHEHLIALRNEIESEAAAAS